MSVIDPNLGVGVPQGTPEPTLSNSEKVVEGLVLDKGVALSGHVIFNVTNQLKDAKVGKSGLPMQVVQNKGTLHPDGFIPIESLKFPFAVSRGLEKHFEGIYPDEKKIEIEDVFDLMKYIDVGQRTYKSSNVREHLGVKVIVTSVAMPVSNEGKAAVDVKVHVHSGDNWIFVAYDPANKTFGIKQVESAGTEPIKLGAGPKGEHNNFSMFSVSEEDPERDKKIKESSIYIIGVKLDKLPPGKRHPKEVRYKYASEGSFIALVKGVPVGPNATEASVIKDLETSTNFGAEQLFTKESLDNVANKILVKLKTTNQLTVRMQPIVTNVEKAGMVVINYTNKVVDFDDQGNILINGVLEEKCRSLPSNVKISKDYPLIVTYAKGKEEPYLNMEKVLIYVYDDDFEEYNICSLDLESKKIKKTDECVKLKDIKEQLFWGPNKLKEIEATLDLNKEGKPLAIITQPKSDMLVFNYTGLKLDFDKNGVPFIKHNGKSIKIWNTAHRVNMAHFTQEKPDEPMVAFYDDTDNNYIWISDYEKETKLRYGYRINRSDREHPKLEPEHPKLEPEPPMGERKLELRQLFCGPNNLKEIATTLGLKIGDPPPVFTSPGGRVMNVINYTDLKLDFDKKGWVFIKHNEKSIKVANVQFAQEVLEKPMIIFDDPEKHRIWICDYDDKKNEKVYYAIPIDISNPEHPLAIPKDAKKATRAFLVNASEGIFPIRG